VTTDLPHFFNHIIDPYVAATLLLTCENSY